MFIFQHAFLAFSITPNLVSKFGKRKFVLLCLLGVALASPMAFIFYNLRINTRERATTNLVSISCVYHLFFISTLSSIAGNMARDSMIGDIADEVDLAKRKETRRCLVFCSFFCSKGKYCNWMP